MRTWIFFESAKGGDFYTLDSKSIDMDIEIENQIELLERKRDIALRIRNTLYAKKIQRVIDKLAKESRNKSMDDKKDKK